MIITTEQETKGQFGATMQELLDYCEAIEIEEALQRTLTLEFLQKYRDFPISKERDNES